MGDLNASADEGDATDDPMGNLYSSSYIDGTVTPESVGGVENASSNSFSATHTADWSMRADYVLPSTFGLTVEQTAVYWPSEADVNYGLVGPGLQSSDHRLVWLDASFTGQAADDTTPDNGDNSDGGDTDDSGDSGDNTDGGDSDDTGDAQTPSKKKDSDGFFGSFGYGFILLAIIAGLTRRIRSVRR